MSASRLNAHYIIGFIYHTPDPTVNLIGQVLQLGKYNFWCENIGRSSFLFDMSVLIELSRVIVNQRILIDRFVYTYTFFLVSRLILNIAGQTEEIWEPGIKTLRSLLFVRILDITIIITGGSKHKRYILTLFLFYTYVQID